MGTSGLLRQLRYRDQPFDAGQLHDALVDAGKRHDKTPEEAFYSFDEKVDIKECWTLTGKAPIGVRWVDINKGDSANPNCRSRLIVTKLHF